MCMIVAHHNVESNKSFFQLPGGRGVIVYESLIGCQWLVYNTFAFWPQIPLELRAKHSLANSHMPLPKIKWITSRPMWHNHFSQYNARTMHCIHFCCSSLKIVSSEVAVPLWHSQELVTVNNFLSNQTITKSTSGFIGQPWGSAWCM